MLADLGSGAGTGRAPPSVRAGPAAAAATPRASVESGRLCVSQKWQETEDPNKGLMKGPVQPVGGIRGIPMQI